MIGMDTSIAGMAQIGAALPGLTATAVQDFVPLWVANEDGRTVPLVPANGPDAVLAPTYRVVLDRLPAGIAAHLVVASLATNPPVDGQCPEIAAPRRPPTRLEVTGIYTVASPSEVDSVHAATVPFGTS